MEKNSDSLLGAKLDLGVHFGEKKDSLDWATLNASGLMNADDQTDNKLQRMCFRLIDLLPSYPDSRLVRSIGKKKVIEETEGEKLSVESGIRFRSLKDIKRGEYFIYIFRNEVLEKDNVVWVCLGQEKENNSKDYEKYRIIEFVPMFIVNLKTREADTFVRNSSNVQRRISVYSKNELVLPLRREEKK